MKYFLAVLLACVANICVAQLPTLIIPDGHSSPINNNIKLDKQRKYIYTAETNKCIMWNAKTGKQLYTFPLKYATYGDGYVGIDVNADGSKVVIISNNILFLYSTVTGKQIAYSTRFICSDVAFSEDGKYIYAVAYDHIQILDANTLTGDEIIEGDISSNAHVLVLPGGKIVIVDQKHYDIYNPATKQKTFSYNFPDEMDYHKIMPFQNLFALYNNVAGKGISFYDIYTGAKKGFIAYSQDITQAAILPSENTNEILITNPVPAAAKNVSFTLYSTGSFQKIDVFSNVNPNYNGGSYDGLKKQMWVATDPEEVGKYDFITKKYGVFLKGSIVHYVSTFDNIIYDNEHGRLHLSTDSYNFKTVDLAAMKTITHYASNSYESELAVSVTGDTVASFDDDKVIIRNVVTGAVIKPLTSLGPANTLSGDKSNYFFSNDGKYLFYDVGGSIIKLNLTTGIKQPLVKVKSFGYTVINPDKTLMAGFEIDYQVSNAFIWDLTTNKKLFSKPAKQNFIQLSYDKKTVLLEEGKNWNRYDIASNQLLDSVTIPDDLGHSAEVANKDFSLIIRGRSSGEVTMYNGVSGKSLYSIQAHLSDIGEIFFSPDEKQFYTIAEFDNTIKTWETSTGRLIGTLYLFRNSNDYVFMDADGRFDGTQKGVEEIYYVLNQKALPLDRLFETYFTPNLYARSVSGEKFAPINVNVKQAPLVKIEYAEKQRNLEVSDDVPLYQNITGAAEITVTASSEDDAIDEIRLFQNGKVLNLATRNLIVEDDKSKISTKKYTVNLLPGNNEIRAVALNTQRTESLPDIINVTYNDGASSNTTVTPLVNNKTNIIVDKIDKNATMYLVVVGINAYKNPKLSLNYALADATAFKDEVEKDAKTVITNIKTFFVTDDAADKTGITNAIVSVQQNAKPQDVFVFYYAGHGVIADNKEFYLVPNDVTDLKNVDEALTEHGIAAKDLQQYAINIQAQKQLFILDACQSAGAFADMLSDDGTQQKNIAVVARSTGTHWLAASGAQQFANEFSTLGHGAFTYVLLQALKGEAANNKMVTVDGLKLYMQTGVPALMKKYNGSQQTPASYGFGNDFPVELIK
ncbi:MAG TPA: caspase family protein [Panacibacter sp.]|nr:caspase family protein [Panacibacter sp.]